MFRPVRQVAAPDTKSTISNCILLSARGAANILWLRLRDFEAFLFLGQNDTRTAVYCNHWARVPHAKSKRTTVKNGRKIKWSYTYFMVPQRNVDRDVRL